jgi:hypothetical protein
MSRGDSVCAMETTNHRAGQGSRSAPHIIKSVVFKRMGHTFEDARSIDEVQPVFGQIGLALGPPPREAHIRSVYTIACIGKGGLTKIMNTAITPSPQITVGWGRSALDAGNSFLHSDAGSSPVQPSVFAHARDVHRRCRISDATTKRGFLLIARIKHDRLGDLTYLRVRARR